MANALANVVGQGNSVAESRAAWMRGGREKAIVRRMSTIHGRMGNPAEDSDIVAMFLKQFQVGGATVIATAILGKETFRQQTEVVAEATHSLTCSARPAVGNK